MEGIAASRWKRVAARAALVAFALLCLFLGSVAADPVGSSTRAWGARLRAAGALRHFFRGPDGTTLRALSLGKLSAKVPVVMLHGLGATAEYWTDAAIDLARSGETVLLPDAPGSGGSTAPRSPEGYGLASRVAAVAALANALGFETFDLVGHSLGGWTAGAYALAEPRRIRRLVLVDAGGFTLPADVEAYREALTPRTREDGARLVELLFFRGLTPRFGFVADGLARNYREPCVVETVRQVGERDGLVGHEPELPRGTVLIWGEKDPIMPIGDARRAAALIPGARLLVITGVGHDGPLEAPRAFREALRRARS